MKNHTFICAFINGVGPCDCGAEPELPPFRHGLPEYYDLLQVMAELHDKKSHDYASSENPLGNYYFAGEASCLFSHSPKDAGIVGRMAEKIYRIANLERNGKEPINESIEETENDLAVIMTLWIADRRARRNKK